MEEPPEDGKTPGRRVSKLTFNALEGRVKSEAHDDKSDGWGEPADIPDRPGSAQDLDAVADISIRVIAVLGRTKMTVGEVVNLGRGAVIELDRKVGEPVDVFLNTRLVARAEVVVVDQKLGINMTEIIKEKRD